MNRSEAIKTIEKVGEDFGWQVGKVGANYENGYMKAIMDCKFALQNAKDDFVEDNSGYFQNGKDHIVEPNKIVVTNEDYIKNMSDKELARFLDCIGVCKFINVCRDKPCEKCVEKWLKEKVE